MRCDERRKKITAKILENKLFVGFIDRLHEISLSAMSYEVPSGRGEGGEAGGIAAGGVSLSS